MRRGVDPCERRDRPQGRVADAQRGGPLCALRIFRAGQPGVRFSAPPAPHEPPVQPRQHVVSLHRAVGIQPRFVVERPVDQRHDKPHDPQPDVGAVFEPEVEQSQQDAGDLQEEFYVHCFNIRIVIPKRTEGPTWESAGSVVRSRLSPGLPRHLRCLAMHEVQLFSFQS